jgi:hypothetical protein
MRAISSVLFLSTATFALTACQTFWNPTFMPAGYSYHNNVYKSAPGPESKELGYDYSLKKNAEILAEWDIAVSDLVDQLEQQSGISAQTVYLHPPAVKSPFNTTFDESLRIELRDRGYTIARVSGDAPHIKYEALIPGEAEERLKEYYNDDPEDQKPQRLPVNGDFILTLTVLDETILRMEPDESAAILAQVSNTYALPIYGYERAQRGIRLSNPVYGSTK